MNAIRTALAVLSILLPRRRPRWVVVQVGPGGCERVFSRQFRTEQDVRVARAVEAYEDWHHEYEVRQVIR